MNMDEMNEEKNAAESGANAPEEKNANEPLVTGQADTQDAVNSETEEGKTPAGEVAEPASQSLKPGAQLAAFRIAAGLDQEQVAASLKMTVRQIRELEADNYDALHGVAVSRGFIRAYAKMLQVDPEPLVAMFKAEEPPSKPVSQIPRRNIPERFIQNNQTFGKGRRMGKTSWLILIGVVLVLVYGVYSMKWFSGGFSLKKKTEPVADVKKQEASKSVSTEIETPKVVIAEPEKTPASAESAADKGEKAAETSAVGKEENKPAAAAPPIQDADKPKADKADPPSPPQDKQDKTAASQQEKPVEAAAAVPQNFLVVRFTGPSKVRVLKANDSVLREFDEKTGDIQKLEINEPVTVVAEKAANVQLEFRGKPLVLRTARRSAEARVELK